MPSGAVRPRLARAVAVAASGTVVLWLVGRALPGLVGTRADLIAGAVTSLAATCGLARAAVPTVSGNLATATRIVFLTLAGIAVAHGVDQVFVRGSPLDEEPLVKLFWAVLGTSWWLVPGTALVLAAVGRVQLAAIRA